MHYMYKANGLLSHVHLRTRVCVCVCMCVYCVNMFCVHKYKIYILYLILHSTGVQYDIHLQ